jgi:MoxR-like ATPase
VFTQLLMADEINRASPRTQSALLQAMQEKHVTVAAQRYDLPTPFHVLATQNPLEQEGTYPLPEAQLDRFLLQIDVGYPDLDAERKMLVATTFGEEATPMPVFTPSALLEAQKSSVICRSAKKSSKRSCVLCARRVPTKAAPPNCAATSPGVPVRAQARRSCLPCARKR